MPYNHMYYRHRVAPRVGAWIETDRLRYSEGTAASLPVWERGLKHTLGGITTTGGGRSPCGSVD